MKTKYATNMLIHLSSRQNFCNYPRIDDDAPSILDAELIASRAKLLHLAL